LAAGKDAITRSPSSIRWQAISIDSVARRVTPVLTMLSQRRSSSTAASTSSGLIPADA